MGIFGVYALICTFLLMVYYMVTIWFDLHGNKGSRKEETETIATGDMVDTETSTDVRELDGGGYQLSSSDFEDEPMEVQVQEEPSAELGAEAVVTPPEPTPDPAGVKKDDDEDSSEGPSEYERAKKVHDENCQHPNKTYEMQLMGVGMLAKMTIPISQKNEVHRHRSRC